MSLDSWEERFEAALNSIPENQRLKAGAVLSTIPSREEWECFVATVRDAWRNRDWACAVRPACLVILYDGVAFFEFRSGAFWDGFAAVVSAAVPVNLQTTINHLFAQAAGRFKLPVTQGSYVSSSVGHIGIPLSMWDAFLLVCEWALWTERWHELSEEFPGLRRSTPHEEMRVVPLG